MNGYLITLIVIFTLLLALLLMFLVNLIFIGIFSKKLREHSKTLTIVLTQKYESFLMIFEIFDKNKVEVKKELFELFDSIDITHFEKMDTPESIKDRNSLSLLKQEIIGSVKNNVEIQKNEEFKLAINMLNSIDEQFRNVVAAYNADVIGFNYWIRFLAFKYLFLFNHVEKKEIIS